MRDSLFQTIRTTHLSFHAQFDLGKEVRVKVFTLLRGSCTNNSELLSPPAELVLQPSGTGKTKIWEWAIAQKRPCFRDATRGSLVGPAVFNNRGEQMVPIMNHGHTIPNYKDIMLYLPQSQPSTSPRQPSSVVLKYGQWDTSIHLSSPPISALPVCLECIPGWDHHGNIDKSRKMFEDKILQKLHLSRGQWNEIDPRGVTMRSHHARGPSAPCTPRSGAWPGGQHPPGFSLPDRGLFPGKGRKADVQSQWGNVPDLNLLWIHHIIKSSLQTKLPG